jgi:predicted phage terminase large subunit-like protein
MRNPSASGLEQQEPSPQSGDFFESSWIDENTYEDINILKDGQFYGASDHAVSEAQSADDTCMGLGVYKKGILYIHPDLVWDRIGPEKTVSEFLRYGRTYSILRWRAEKGHISKSLMPFLQKRMTDEKVFFSIYQVTPVKDKQTRAHSIKGMMQLGLVKWPSFAPWFQRARRQLLMFPNGRHDDFVDFLSHLGMEVNKMFSDNTPKPSLVEEPDYNAPGWKITLPQIKAQNKFASRTRWQLTHR